MKYKISKYAVVLQSGFEFAFVQEVDWETDLSFGKRGKSEKMGRTTYSTGTMIKKADCVYKMFDEQNDAYKWLHQNIKPLEDKIKQYKSEIQNTINEMKKVFN